jgi:hypothetical protein
MPGSFDSSIVKNQLNDVYHANRPTASSIHRRFAHEHDRITEWRQHGPIFVHQTEEGPTLVKFEFETEMSAPPAARQEIIDQRMKEVEDTLTSMLKPNEEYHLELEERPHVGDVPSNHISFYIRGVIVPKVEEAPADDKHEHIDPHDVHVTPHA